MPSFELMAALDELAPGARKSIFVDDLPALLLRIENDYFAIEDVCTHDGQPLTDGPVIDGQIVCPRHGARFDLADGRPTKMPATSPIRVFAVDVRNDGVYVSPKAPGTVPSTPTFAATPVPAVPESTTDVTQTPVEESGDPAAEVTDEALIEALRTVIDPELMINIVDLGLVYNINQNGRKVAIEMTLTSPACPAGPQIIQQSRTALERVNGIDEATIKLVMTPPWSPERMTDEARDQLGIF
jgi:metal-sulfur cluster biosynthetic enzyme/nitrite reductase/ring-hydroxylating ferredoxin subunit